MLKYLHSCYISLLKKYFSETDLLNLLLFYVFFPLFFYVVVILSPEDRILFFVSPHILKYTVISYDPSFSFETIITHRPFSWFGILYFIFCSFAIIKTFFFKKCCLFKGLDLNVVIKSSIFISILFISPLYLEGAIFMLLVFSIMFLIILTILNLIDYVFLPIVKTIKDKYLTFRNRFNEICEDTHE